MFRTRFVIPVIGVVLALPAAAVAQNDEYRQRMEDAQEAKDNLMDAVKTKSASKASEAAGKIAKILEETKAFWAAQKMDDVVKLADAGIASANDMAKIAASGKMDAAKAAFDKINAACSACHDIHPEERLKK